ncbi:NAD(P)/FAD-dependent oxidoreductase [Burkholderia oklahomensis]|uniref:NAD(P)/FAD-dependent oxidoreductase n=1 Tax=Burkholderia oklahomensis TaxID=342113 RepID=UPI00016A74C8|nr:FAD/NAD(P)-binding oxidoreductase [Burkholderia oklahomensis]AJX33361.1 pyridine nucleotide-disulfide oxidoreductase family protein [Burkholderia oklahomensis C6786]AOI46187.1 pyridine nucleotide-disulfide oxidoreductase [Burkholderia oklahomensis C6786]KUY64133.1 pyridine nucleotide-disulfide oxidoreductase [Burkholderia oklahomensis C6786]MBI0361237.1 NAD(P)/FAD-dependent oxidoreductase [Burkholderia oklahomensis]SUW55004.1 Sulfide dehydrogenase [flavocytochrome c] flavoprotein chain prec
MSTQILIVGGGLGGTMLANQLASKLFDEVVRNDVRLTLLSDSPDHDYKPAFMYVAFGACFRNELTRAERSLLRPEIAFVVDRATHFDFATQHVHTKSGKRYGYDHLVIATGCVPSPERIEGLAEAGDHFYQYEPARRLAERIASIERGTVFVTVTFPKTHNVPHQCGIAPIETTLMLDDALRRRGVRDKVEIVYTYPTVSQLLRNCLFLQKPTCDVLPALFEQRGIRYQRGFTLARVDPARKIASSEEGAEQPFDILMATPPIRAVEAVRESGVSEAADDEGWLPTDHETLRVRGIDNVHAIGDTVDLPVSKAGGACHNQAPVIADNIAAQIRLGHPVACYDGKVQAVAQMGLDAGMPLWYDYRRDVRPTPPTKLGGLLRVGFNRGIYWAVARGLA